MRGILFFLIAFFVFSGYESDVRAQSSTDSNSLTVNISNVRGGYTAVVLKKAGNGYVGPQGEFYPSFPTVTQLQTFYGNSPSTQQTQQELQLPSGVTRMTAEEEQLTPQEQQAATKQVQTSDPLKVFWDQEQPKLDEQIKHGKILKIKDLYLGMSIDQACKVLNQKLGTSFEVNVFNGQGSDLMNLLLDSQVLNGYSCAGIYSDDQKQVYLIILNNGQVDQLFNSTGIPGADFAKRFMDGYGISEMQPYSKQIGEETDSGWQYVSPDGYKLTIYENKNLIIEKVPKASEMKFN